MVLADLEADMASAALGSCSDEEIAGLLQRALAGRQVVAGFVNRLAGEARRREVAGRGSPAAEVIRAGGTVSNREARELDRRAGVGEILPEVGAGVDRGDTRSENADTLARHLEGLTDAQRAALAAHDHEIARQAAWAPPETFRRWLGRLIRRITEPDPEPGRSRVERQRAASDFGMKRRGDGMWKVWGQLDDVRGAELNDVLHRAARRLNDGEASPNAKADALHRLVTRRPRSGDRQQAAGATQRGSRPESTPRSVGATQRGAGSQPAAADERRTDVPDLLAGFDPGAAMGVGYIVDAATLARGPHEGTVAQTWAGSDVEPAAVGHLACDTDLYAILYDELGRPTKVGRTRRAATRAQRLQLRGLYDSCPLDGTPFGECEIHHVNLPWEDGGETEVDNLLPVSRAWHHRIHDRGWRLKMSRTDR